MMRMPPPSRRLCLPARGRWLEWRPPLSVLRRRGRPLRLDELLWQLPPDRFVPHPVAGRAVRPRWRSAISRRSGVMPAFINLARQTPLFADTSPSGDFVPLTKRKKAASPRALQTLSPGGPHPEMRISPSCRTGSGAALTAPPSIHDESTPESIHPSRIRRDHGKDFNHNAIEQALYQHWEAQGYFKPHGDTSKDSFCIMIPPPNVTGSSARVTPSSRP